VMADSIRCSVGLSFELVLGEPCEIERSLLLGEVMDDGIIAFRAQRITANIGGSGVVMLRGITVAGVSLLYGDGCDAWQFNPCAVGNYLDSLNCYRDNRVSVVGHYNGRLPYWGDPQYTAPFKAGEKFVFIVSLIGPVMRREG
jgi:hypothetical protein